MTVKRCSSCIEDYIIGKKPGEHNFVKLPAFLLNDNIRICVTQNKIIWKDNANQKFTVEYPLPVRRYQQPL